MCYSAQIQANYRRYVRMFGAHMSIEDFAKLYFERVEAASKVKIPKALDAAFLEAADASTEAIRRAIGQFNETQAAALQQERFKQRARLADAERTLQTKLTKAASEMQTHSDRQNRGCGEAHWRPQAKRTETSGLAHLPRVLRTSPRR